MDQRQPCYTFNDPRPIPAGKPVSDIPYIHSGVKAATHVLLLDLGLKVKKQSVSSKYISVHFVLTSSSGVKSLTMLNNLRISSGVLPLIIFATVLQPTSLDHSCEHETNDK